MSAVNHYKFVAHTGSRFGCTEINALHGTLSGPAIQKFMERLPYHAGAGPTVP